MGPNTPSDFANSPMVAAVAGPSNTASPSAFTALNGNPPPPAKKAKLTFAEKEEMRLLKEAEKAKEKAEKAQKDKANAEEKARKLAEKEAERKVKEAEKEEKRAAAAAEKAAKEEKKRKREEEKKKKEDEKKQAEEKKARSQKKLSNFFAIPATSSSGRRGSMDSAERTSMSPAPQTSNSSLLAAGASPGASTPRKPVLSHYEKTFPEFFVHADVTLAKVNRFERDEEGIISTQNAIDGYMSGDRSPGRVRPFDATSLFHLTSSNVRRGKYPMPVRDIMTEFSGAYSRVIDLTTDSQNSQIKRMRELLRKVPVKIIMHAEDVRPPYRGTYTSRPVNGMAKLARNPWRKELPDKNYDYDSEAEWIEDEDAEDCMSDGEEEEDVEDGEDMEGFLDDENDELANGRRTATHGNNDLEPISTGLCWEDKHKRSANVKMMPYRMEIILGKFDDPPFSMTSLTISRFKTQIHRPILNLLLALHYPHSHGPSPCPLDSKESYQRQQHPPTSFIRKQIHQDTQTQSTKEYQGKRRQTQETP